MDRLSISYDVDKDVLIVNGKQWDGKLFRNIDSIDINAIKLIAGDDDVISYIPVGDGEDSLSKSISEDKDKDININIDFNFIPFSDKEVKIARKRIAEFFIENMKKNSG